MLYFRKLRELITRRVAANTLFLSGEIELDESYFSGHRKGKCGRGDAGKVITFNLLKRGGKVWCIPQSFQIRKYQRWS